MTNCRATRIEAPPQRDEREQADGESAPEREARSLDAAGVEPARIGGERLEQRVLDDDGQPEGHQDRGQDASPEQAVEDQHLERVAERGHDGHDEGQGDERIQPERLPHDHREERGQDAEVAVGQVDDAHHPEDEREAGGEERVEPAQQEPLQDGVEPAHRHASPK
jgi:hypothetical protein